VVFSLFLAACGGGGGGSLGLDTGASPTDDQSAQQPAEQQPAEDEQPSTAVDTTSFGEASLTTSVTTSSLITNTRTYGRWEYAAIRQLRDVQLPGQDKVYSPSHLNQIASGLGVLTYSGDVAGDFDPADATADETQVDGQVYATADFRQTNHNGTLASDRIGRLSVRVEIAGCAFPFALLSPGTGNIEYDSLGGGSIIVRGQDTARLYVTWPSSAIFEDTPTAGSSPSMSVEFYGENDAKGPPQVGGHAGFRISQSDLDDLPHPSLANQLTPDGVPGRFSLEFLANRHNDR